MTEERLESLYEDIDELVVPVTTTQNNVENVIEEIGTKILLLQDQANHVKNRKSELIRHEKVLSKEIEKLSKTTESFMKEFSLEEVITENVSVTIKESNRYTTEIEDENLITKAYKVISWRPDKTKALAAFKKGKPPKGFKFFKTKKLEVK